MLFTGFRPYSLMSWITRAKLIAMLWREDWRPVVRMNGVDFDFKNRKVVIHNPTHIHYRDTLLVTSDKHIIMNSGRKQVEGREPGYVYGFWANTDLDADGNPILERPSTSIFESEKRGSIKLSPDGTITF